MNEPRIIRTLGLAALLLAGSAVAADIYVRKDTDKSTEYSDRPAPGAELISHTKAQRPQPPAPAPAPAAKPATTPKNTVPADPAAQSAASEQVQKDLANTRPEQCRSAREDYDKAIRARRMTRQGANGQVQFLSEAEIAAQRVQMQERVRDFCGTK